MFNFAETVSEMSWFNWTDHFWRMLNGIASKWGVVSNIYITGGRLNSSQYRAAAVSLPYFYPNAF